MDITNLSKMTLCLKKHQLDQNIRPNRESPNKVDVTINSNGTKDRDDIPDRQQLHRPDKNIKLNQGSPRHASKRR